jgi:hypothetical protein
MNSRDRLKTLEREQEYRAWIAAGEFFRHRSFAKLLFLPPYSEITPASVS